MPRRGGFRKALVGNGRRFFLEWGTPGGTLILLAIKHSAQFCTVKSFAIWTFGESSLQNWFKLI